MASESMHQWFASAALWNELCSTISYLVSLLLPSRHTDCPMFYPLWRYLASTSFRSI